MQIIDDIHVPKENWNQGVKPEPITAYFGKDNPEGKNFGEGGYSQAITNSNIENFDLKEVAGDKKD